MCNQASVDEAASLRERGHGYAAQADTLARRLAEAEDAAKQKSALLEDAQRVAAERKKAADEEAERAFRERNKRQHQEDEMKVRHLTFCMYINTYGAPQHVRLRKHLQGTSHIHIHKET